MLLIQNLIRSVQNWINNKLKIELGTFIGLTMALCATVRSIPTLAAVGWTLISYTIFAVLFFAGQSH